MAKNKIQKITPFLWFDTQAAEAARYYTSIFKGKITSKTVHESTPSGKVEVFAIEILGQTFTLMSAGPYFKINEAISFVIDYKDQKEVDYYWKKLTSNGGQESMCGWLKDKYGVSWQVVPRRLIKLTGAKDKKKAAKAMQAMLKMKKIIIKDIEKAYNKE